MSTHRVGIKQGMRQDSEENEFALDLYPGILTPALVTCSTNMREGLVKLITCSDVPGC